jgi:hypothetical protein
VSFAQFARLLGFGINDANCIKIHMALKLDARKVKFMYLGASKEILVRPSTCSPSLHT